MPTRWLSPKVGRMNDTETATEPRSMSRSTWIIGAIVGVVLVVAAAAAIGLTSGREDAHYLPGSPEAAFQEYVRVWEVGDTETAWAALTLRAQEQIPRHEFNSANRWRTEESRRVWIEEVLGSEERPVLHLTVETIYHGGLFGSDRYREDSRVVMVREDGAWKIDSPIAGHYRW
jgi:hypothetical protein